MSIGYNCDTPDCNFWSEDGCTKAGPIAIQEHSCVGYEKKKPMWRYSLIAGLPALLSEIFVTVSGGAYYKARLLGYGVYGNNVGRKTYCVEVIREDGCRFVDFFESIYSRRLEVENDG